MELKQFTMEDLLLAAIKSEVEAREVYLQLADNVDNGFLFDKLKFIADEENKHKDYLESIFKMEMQKGLPVLPQKSPVPLPEIEVKGKVVMVSEIMGQAMDAELAASDFYNSLSERFPDEERRTTLQYLSKMEIGHYKLLEIEKEILENQEDYEFEWEMMHAGP